MPMATILEGCLALVVILLFGSAVILSQSRDRLRRVSECLLLGPFALLLSMEVLTLCGIALTRTSVACSAAALAVAGLVLRRRRGPDVDWTVPTIHDRAPLLVGGFLTLLVALFSFDQPILVSDPVTIYAPPAVLYAEHGRLDPRLLARVVDPQHLDYPPLFTASYAWVFIASGGYDGWLVKLLGPLYFAGLLLEMLALCRQHGARAPLLWTLIPALAPITLKASTSGFADIAVTAYLAGGLSSLCAWKRTGGRRDLLRSALMLAAAAATKNEGAALAVLFLFLGTSTIGRRANPSPPEGSRGGRARLGVPGAWGLLLLLNVPWYWAVRALGFENDLVEGVSEVGIREALSRVPVVARFFFDQLFLHPSDLCRWFPMQGLLYPLAAFSLFVALIKGGRTLLKWKALVLPAQLLLFFAVFLFTYQDVRWHLDTSLPRLLLQCFPAALLFCVSILGADSIAADAVGRHSRESGNPGP